MSTAVEALYKLSSQIESDIESRELKWTTKYKSLKRDVKQWKKKAKHGKEMTRVLQRENERLWEFIFSHSLHGKSVEMPALGKKEIVELTGQKDDIPCVTPPKESESSTVIKQEKTAIAVKEKAPKTEIVIEDTESEEEVVVAKKEEVEVEEVQVEEEVEEVEVEEEVEEVEVEEEVEEVEVEEEVEEQKEEVVVEQKEVEEQKEEVVVEQKEVEEEEEEEELFEVEIDGVDYYTSNEVSGLIYEKKADGEVGEELGYFEDGEPGFYE
jgi:hypothetical protein